MGLFFCKMETTVLNLKEKLSYDQLKKELLRYKNLGFKWRRTQDSFDRCQIWGPTTFYDGENLERLMEYYDIKKLELGKKSQIEDLEALTLFGLIFNNNSHEDFWDSEKLN